MDQDNKPVQVRQTNHTARSIAKAFLFVFHVKYLRSSAIARNTFTSSTNMQTTLTRINKWDRNSEIIAEVFPLNYLTFSTPQSTQIGMLTSAFVRSANARLAIRMFGKVRSFLNRATIPRTNPLPRTAKTAISDRSRRMKIVRVEKPSASMSVCLGQASRS